MPDAEAASPSSAAARGGPFALLDGPAGEPALFLLVAGVALASRLPFLGPGYGFDPDAWRVACAAHDIVATGHYVGSRFPGYPVQEFASALLLRGGATALCAASALMAAIAAGCFALVFRRLGGRDSLLAGLALASAPAVFLTSVQAMDYAWALAFALAGLLAALGGRALAAGVLVGLGIGCRLPTGVWLAPVAIVLGSRARVGARTRAVATFLGAALATGALAFLPVALEYGTRFFRFYQTGYPPLVWVAKMATVDLWGIPGTLALAALALPALLALARGARARALPASPPLALAWSLGVALTVVAFLRLPYKSAYLIPTVPLALLLLAQGLGRRTFAALAVALLLSPWLLKVSQPGQPDDPGFTTGRSTVALAGRPFVVDWLHGPVVSDQARRRQRMRYVDGALAGARRLAAPSIVVAYDWLPQIRARLGRSTEGRARFVYLLTADSLRVFRAQGLALYALAGAAEDDAKVYGVDLAAAGVRPLDAAR